MTDTRKWESYVAQRRASSPEAPARSQNLFEVMHETEISCHGGGSEHKASICLECPRFISCVTEDDGRSLVVSCWWHREAPTPKTGKRRLARGSGLIDTEALRCACCGIDEDVFAHPRMEEVPICEQCLDASQEPIDYLELGYGD